MNGDNDKITLILALYLLRQKQTDFW